jgi:hypothetical protein
MCFSYLYKSGLKNFSFQEELGKIGSKIYIGPQVTYQFSCQILMKLESSLQIFGKHSNIDFHEKPLSGSRVDPRGQKDRRTERYDKAFRNFANAPPKTISSIVATLNVKPLYTRQKITGTR